MGENTRSAKPWDLLNPNMVKVSQDIVKERLSICATCPEFFTPTKTCKKCGCIMILKAKLGNASCPIGKWDATVKEEVN